jgi:hypothetical protein
MGEKKVSRRGLLGLLGMSAVVAPTYAMGVDTAFASERDKSVTMMNFTCACGEGLMTETPKKIGDQVYLECKCGNRWTLTWEGDHFTTTLRRDDGNTVNTFEDGVKVTTPPNAHGRTWLTSRSFDFEQAEWDGVVFQKRMECRHRSDGKMVYHVSVIREGNVRNDDDFWNIWLEEDTHLPSYPPVDFHKDFAEQMAMLKGTEVFG